jgi:hypothetical protein
VVDCSASTPVEDEIRVLVVNSMLAPGLGRRNEMACMEACGVIEITCGMKVRDDGGEFRAGASSL